MLNLNATLTYSIITTINIENSLFENKQILGWLLIDREKDFDLASMKHEEIYDLVGVAGKIIIENERLYDIKQESLK